MMSDLVKADPEIALRNDVKILSTHWMTNPYIQAATSDNTRRAYRSDIRHFENWGGQLPATPQGVIHYLQAYAERLNSRTLARRVTAIKNWHIYQGFYDPTSHPAILKTLIGIQRVHGKPKEKARPLLLEELLKIVSVLKDENTLASLRDSALLQIGFFGAFRRSELVAIHVEHITWQKEGIEIIIPHSKTDQTNEGQYCAIPYGNAQFCPVIALKIWVEKAGIKQGPIFKRFISGDKVGITAVTPLSVNHILKSRAGQVGLSNLGLLSSHSLRRGFATCAAKAKADLRAIMRQARWKHVNTAIGYIEAGEQFINNAASELLKNILS